MDCHYNVNCREDTMRSLDQLLRTINPYYFVFRRANELYTNEVSDQSSQVHAREVKMYLVHNHTDDRRRYNDPVPSSDMAIVFADRDGNPPERSFFRIYPTDGPIREIHCSDPNRDPMVYPLLFPGGDFGKHIKLKFSSN